MSRLIPMAVEILLLILLMIAVPLVIISDAIIIGHGIPENSATEYSQEVLILFSSVLFWLGALRYHDSRGFFVLVAGLFGCMFIRECDVYLDRFSHGFWGYPVFFLASFSILYSLRCRGTVVSPMAEHAETKSGAYLVIGFLLVSLFSRIFGTGQFWRLVMGFDYHISYKAIIQEGLELLGYMLIFFGSAMFFLQREHCEKDFVKGGTLKGGSDGKLNE